jgi:hypothetical protein
MYNLSLSQVPSPIVTPCTLSFHHVRNYIDCHVRSQHHVSFIKHYLLKVANDHSSLTNQSHLHLPLFLKQLDRLGAQKVEPYFSVAFQNITAQDDVPLPGSQIWMEVLEKLASSSFSSSRSSSVSISSLSGSLDWLPLEVYELGPASWLFLVCMEENTIIVARWNLPIKK